MKVLALLFSLSLYLLLPNPTHSTRNPIRLPTADSPVLDTDGDALRPGGDYIIASAILGPLGRPQEVALSAMDTWTSTCPDVVTITPFTGEGVPVTITPADPNATVVSPSTSLSFSFNNVPDPWDCAKKSYGVYWLVQRNPKTDSPYYVNAGDFLSNNSNQFKIEAEPNLNAYKITYCHFGTDECNNVGSIFFAWLRASRLFLSEDDPFVVVFKKAS